MALPSVMEITQASEFDTPFIQTKSDRWEYVRLGRLYTNIFDLDVHGNKLLKILSVMYSESHIPFGQLFVIKKFLKEAKQLSFEYFLNYLEVRAKTGKAKGYFEVKAITKYLIRIGFPNFNIDDEEVLVRVAAPIVNDPFLRYQEVENTIPTHLKSLIANRLVEFSTEEGLLLLSDQELKISLFWG